MNELWADVVGFIGSDRMWSVVRATVLVIVGVVLSRIVASVVRKLVHKKIDSHRAMLIKRGSAYLILTLFLVSALRELGFNLSVLLGAAGILTVAVGFASQTSASNLISGLFLVAERPFSVGDVIKVGTTTGEVLSIDLLSVKLRTFDNLFVRIPNEFLIKSEVTTLTRFPIRRIDVMLGVAYKENLQQVKTLLDGIAAKNPVCLEEPKPLYIFQGFGESSIDIQYSIWAKRENVLELKNSFHEQVKTVFEEHGIVIPFPQRTLHSGDIPDPFPVQVVTQSQNDLVSDNEINA